MGNLYRERTFRTLHFHAGILFVLLLFVLWCVVFVGGTKQGQAKVVRKPGSTKATLDKAKRVREKQEQRQKVDSDSFWRRLSGGRGADVEQASKSSEAATAGRGGGSNRASEQPRGGTSDRFGAEQVLNSVMTQALDSAMVSQVRHALKVFDSVFCRAHTEVLSRF